MDTPGAAAPPTECPACRGTGFVTGVENGLSFAKRCACRQREARGLRLAAAAIPPRYRHCDLDARFEHLDESLTRAFAFAERMVHEYGIVAAERRRGLLFQGRCGVGKTHLAVGVLRKLLENYPVTGLFTEFTDLLRRIQDTYDRRSDTPSAAVLRPVLESDVLVLDDLGCTRMTPWVQDTLGLIVNERYNANRVTLVTTNHPLKSAPNQETLGERIGERLSSRLLEMCFVVEMKGKDYRDTVKAAGDDFLRRN